MRVLLFAVCAAVCAVPGWYLYQYSLQSQTQPDKPPKQELVAVEAVQVCQGTVLDRIELVGSLEAVTEVSVRSRVDGYLTALPFDIGDEVGRNDMLAELDDRTTREAVSRAQAVLEIAQAQLQAQVAREAQARREVDRLQALADSGVSTEQQQEEAVSAWEVARAEIQLEQARLNQAQSDLKQANLALTELELRSPLTGFVAERNVDVGDLARAEDVLVRIVDLSTIRTIVNVIERDYPKIHQQQAATIQVDALPGQEFSGTVVHKAPVLNPETRAARVSIEIPNPDGLLKPGMHARVRIVAAAAPNATLIPSSALMELDGQPFVYVARADAVSADAKEPTGDQTMPSHIARRQEVEVGIRDGDTVQIIHGLEPGQQVVTLGSRLITDGTGLEVSGEDWSCQRNEPVQGTGASSSGGGAETATIVPEPDSAKEAAAAPDSDSAGVAGD